MIVIGGGSSVKEYKREKLQRLAGKCFTFAINDSAFKFPCDVVVALDFDWVRANRDALARLCRPIITRKWDGNRKLDLDLIELPNDIPMRLSGQAAAKLADSMARKADIAAYVIGLDHSNQYYYDRPMGNITDTVTKESYWGLECRHTINLGKSSKIDCWPKVDRLPNLMDLTDMERAGLKLYLRSFASQLIRGE